jgi:hypothetical protein
MTGLRFAIRLPDRSAKRVTCAERIVAYLVVASQ